MRAATARNLAFAALCAASTAGPGAALAQGYGRLSPYLPAYPGRGYEPGFAGEFVRGAYIGAPLTKVPRPDRLVPSPWSYGTYGIPTVSGIPEAPIGRPTVTVINPGSHRRDAGGFGGGDPSGAQIIAVRVPRR